MPHSISTLKNALLIPTFALLSFAPVNASAQQKEAIVNVPFAFVANDQAMPAGRYEVLSSASDTSLTFIDANTGRAQGVLLSRSETGGAIETRGVLRFLVIRSRYVLIEVRFGGSSTHNELLAKPKLERSVAGTGPATTTVEIAMK